jgi:hypothetical protein
MPAYRTTPVLIEGETIGERKRSVQKLLKPLGYTANIAEITQKKGELSLSWLPPFTDAFMQQVKRFGEVGAVFLYPDREKAEIARIELVFETYRGVFFYNPIARFPVILASIYRLPVLLAENIRDQAILAQRLAEYRQRRKEAALEPEQAELFPEEED